ncbi:hypothetical protein J2129_000908 [Methanofollis sp. W23]|uniref:hypothetical protein n=1 Tax=Methanofollis sp. W23 TaxID=2817849 RepID=UPI001AEACC12|nr:hypothetical protein [Methanofollis sp. W23]MBP2145454.1 hypothetical protein [Methanofollis sp. W23]
MREFRRAIAALKRNPSVEALEGEAGAWRIRDIVAQAIAASGRDPRATMRAFEGVKACYELECTRRLARLEDRSVLSLHRRRTPYADLYQDLTSIDDPDDIEVVLDAHDLACSMPGLVLWTGDGAHIVRNRERVLDLTELVDVRFLGDTNH